MSTKTPAPNRNLKNDVAQAGMVTDTQKKRGRKPGKHSDESYTQTSIYLPIELRNRVRAKLYERGMEMSGLVEQMLREWLHSAGIRAAVDGAGGERIAKRNQR